MFQSVYEHALGLSPIPDCADTSAYDGDYFGVFVGVTRSAAHAVADWPQNIHGSIGYWDRDFKRVEPEPLCAHTHRVALDAAVNDDRKRYFPDLLTDIEAVLDVKFMCLPVHELDARAGSFADGSIFDNDEWGLLVQTPSGRGATFLPKVYHTDWTAIKSKLVSKASLQPGEPMRFFAYRTKRSARSVCQIYSRTQPRKLLTKIGCCFLKFVNGCAHVPYAVTAQHAVVYDETQDVRNIATLLDVRKLSRVLPCKARTFARDTAHYVRKYLANPESMRQASSFLLPLLQEHTRNCKSGSLDVCARAWKPWSLSSSSGKRSSPLAKNEPCAHRVRCLNSTGKPKRGLAEFYTTRCVVMHATLIRARKRIF